MTTRIGGWLGLQGSSTRSRVGPPSGLDSSIRPPVTATRSASPVRPVPRRGFAPPRPLSVISIVSMPPCWRAVTLALAAPLCLMTFVSASATTK